MTVTIPLKVLELTCSRICHDLISPVGAINNGVELTQELSDEMAEQAMGLIADSGRRAAARLQVFRLALGAAGGQAGLATADVRSVLEDALEGGKTTLDWPVRGAEPALPAGAGRLVVLAAILADEALTYGGRIALTFEAMPSVITVTAEGRAARLPPASLAALDGSLAVGELTARNVIADLARRFAEAMGATITVDLRPAEPAGSSALRLVIGLPQTAVGSGGNRPVST